MQRREFLRGSAAALFSGRSASVLASESNRGNNPGFVFTTANTRWQRAYDRALEILAGNVQVLPRYDGPVLIEGADYQGIWQECGPHESLVYRKIRPDVARNTHKTFFSLQREDGQLPANNKRSETASARYRWLCRL